MALLMCPLGLQRYILLIKDRIKQLIKELQPENNPNVELIYHSNSSEYLALYEKETVYS